MLSMVFADISRKISQTIGFISHSNIPHIFASPHHRNRMITIWKDDVWKRRNKLNLREETSIKCGLGFSRGAKERCNCLCPSTPRVSPHTLCDTLYNSVQGIFLPWPYHSVLNETLQNLCNPLKKSTDTIVYHYRESVPGTDDTIMSTA